MAREEERILVQGPVFAGCDQEVRMANTPDDPRPAEPSSTESELGFDPDSPDLCDPQVDPIGPAKIPGKDHGADGQRPVPKPYDPLADLKM